MTVLLLITWSVSATIDFSQCLPLWTRQMKTKSISTSAVSLTALVTERELVTGSEWQILLHCNLMLDIAGLMFKAKWVSIFKFLFSPITLHLHKVVPIYKLLILTLSVSFFFLFLLLPFFFVYTVSAKFWIGTLLSEAVVQGSSRPHSRDLTLPMGASLRNFNREYLCTAGSCLMSLGHRSLWQHLSTLTFPLEHIWSQKYFLKVTCSNFN